MTAKTWLTFLALALLSVRAQGEESQRGPTGFESLLKSRAPSWSVEKSEASGSSVTYSLVRGEQRMRVSITSLPEAKAAAQKLEALAMRVTAVPTEVKGLGSRGLLWVDSVTGTASLMFQRGGSVLHLVAPSKDEALQLAGEIDKSLQP